MPVLPAVLSTTRPPGLSSPRFSASKIICRAGRSLTDWPGFMNSALPRMVQPVASEARLSLINGVLPMASTIPLRVCMSVAVRLRGEAATLVETRALRQGAAEHGRRFHCSNSTALRTIGAGVA